MSPMRGQTHPTDHNAAANGGVSTPCAGTARNLLPTYVDSSSMLVRVHAITLTHNNFQGWEGCLRNGRSNDGGCAAADP
ncbi:hypothetical protein NWFMUON74_64630 [Nocardia wallacei]|uniref:Uncharacterized protein n=1 Tax=Nocardia wallacei TaxID=480035 RepID=A0A7G1KUT9_9NOCA|nr:hypothetical protein NWFMUON74_64630 [Nocardia wallacei]